MTYINLDRWQIGESRRLGHTRRRSSVEKAITWMQVSDALHGLQVGVLATKVVRSRVTVVVEHDRKVLVEVVVDTTLMGQTLGGLPS